MKDVAQLEAEKAAKLAEVAAIDAQIAAAKEPDWEAWRPFLQAYYDATGVGARADLDIFDKNRIRAFIAAAPLMPVTAMTEAEIEALARKCADDVAIVGCGPSTWQHDTALRASRRAIRATLARGPVAAWPGEDAAVDAGFLVDLASRIFNKCTPAMGFDQYDTDTLLEIARHIRSAHVPEGASA